MLPAAAAHGMGKCSSKPLMAASCGAEVLVLVGQPGSLQISGQAVLHPRAGRSFQQTPQQLPRVRTTTQQALQRRKNLPEAARRNQYARNLQQAHLLPAAAKFVLQGLAPRRLATAGQVVPKAWVTVQAADRELQVARKPAVVPERRSSTLHPNEQHQPVLCES